VGASRGIILASPVSSEFVLPVISVASLNLQPALKLLVERQ
jgi:hypothetical protein